MLFVVERAVSFDREGYLRLKARYRLAVARGESEFVFEGCEFLTEYAGCVLEYFELNGFGE